MEAMSHGPVAGFPLKGVQVRLFDGTYHTVDSSEQAFKTAGSIAMRQAMEKAGAVAAGADHARDAGRARGLASATSSATSTRGAGGRRAWSRDPAA